MARPMQLIGTGSPKEDIVAKLMRTAFLIGLAATWRPDAAAGQYSWSNFSVSVGLGTERARLGIGVSYTAVDPLYDFYFEDPCRDYDYYYWYRHTCHRGYDRIHIRQNYSVVSVNPHHRPRRRSYYWPHGYSSYTHFSLSFGLNFGYGYPSAYYGSRYYTPFYPNYGYPTHGYAAYGYPAYGYPGYGYPAYGYRGYGYPAYSYPSYGYPAYSYPAYGVVRYGGNRRASAVIRPAPAYRGSARVGSSPSYKESPRAEAQRTAAARSITSGRATATRSSTDRSARASRAMSSARAEPPRRRSARVRPSDVISRGAADRTDGLRARRGTSTRLYPPSRARISLPPTSSSRALSNVTQRSAARRSTATPSEGLERSSRAPTTDRAGTDAPPNTAPRQRAQPRSGAVTRSLSLREQAPTARSGRGQVPTTRSGPNARPQAPRGPQARSASPSRSRATQPSARPAPARGRPRAECPGEPRPGEPLGPGQPRRLAAEASNGHDASDLGSPQTPSHASYGDV